jgi:hypothetical protein
MPKTTPEQNKALVLEAFDTLFNKRDYATAGSLGLRRLFPNGTRATTRLSP